MWDVFLLLLDTDTFVASLTILTSNKPSYSDALDKSLPSITKYENSADIVYDSLNNIHFIWHLTLKMKFVSQQLMYEQFHFEIIPLPKWKCLKKMTGEN